jgi:hypothetical protein
MSVLPHLLAHPLTRRLAWVLFSIPFYYSGLAFTYLLLEPEALDNGIQWLLALGFPFLLMAFYKLARYWGCSSGACGKDGCALPADEKDRPNRLYYGPSP